MPATSRKPYTLYVGSKREVHRSVTWQVMLNVWRPATDVYETEASVVVRVEIAGIRDEDLEVMVQGDLLLISGTRYDTSERRAYHQMEIPSGKFYVDVQLPANTLVENASVEYQDGFLKIIFLKEKMDQ